ncbi:MAG: ATP-binding protein [Candidatus Pacebacteria bacterium]|nr:ATP-binding protein [Candidatus Paceibacterota bacterium]
MLIKRNIQEKIENDLWKKKIVIIYGTRQIGKTTLVNQILKKYSENSGYYNCEESDVIEGLSAGTSTALKNFFGEKKLIILDEAQKIRDIGIKLKLLIDNYPEMQIIATGSSSFELANIINEPLTGRFYSYQLYPFSLFELKQIYSEVETNRLLERFLRIGLYPEIIKMGEQEAQKQISLIANNYLFKDIFTFQEVRNPEVLTKLIQMLALQLGNEVSFDELSNGLGVSIETVERYIVLLERAFVIFRLPAFSRNLRTEIKKSRKIYFYDCGIRNALIRNFNSLNLRSDVGALWENFCIIERMKANQRKDLSPNQYFWRTYSQKEIDYLEEQDGRLSAFEFKWSKKKTKIPQEFLDTYKNSKFEVVSKENYLRFLD